MCLLYVFKGVQTLTAHVSMQPSASDEIFSNTNNEEVFGMYCSYLMS